LAEDVTPPPAIATAQMAQPLPTAEPVLIVAPPNTKPNLASGAAIYADRCAACHGVSGEGDGEMVSSLPFPPTALADPNFGQVAVPESWYEIVTRGNLDRLMPPFSTLSDQQRWDVVGFALSLSADPELLEQGQVLFETHCVECHASQAFEATAFQQNSVADISALIDQGIGSQMPAFGADLTQEERTTLASYVQSLGWSRGTEQVVEEAEQEPDVSPQTTASLFGQITSGTPGSAVPEGLEVTILGFDGEQEVVREMVMTDADGAFQVEALDVVPGRLFFATLDHQEVTYQSELSHAPADGSPLELSLTIYETMSDTSTLQVEQLHLLVDFPAEERMRVLQLWVVGNYTDRVLAGEDLLRIDLPEHAANLTFEEGDLGNRFSLTESGFIDREPIPPGSGIDQLVFAFDMPRTRSLEYEQQINYAIDSVTILVPAEGPQISGLEDQGVRDLGGFAMRSYLAGPLSPGDTLSFRLSGAAGAPDSLVTTLIGAAVLLGAVLVAARSRFRSKPAVADPGDPLLAIAQLDDAFEAGELSEHVWRRQRETLKQAALKGMRASDD
jgi:mono/diheme cytochrome c family protein